MTENYTDNNNFVSGENVYFEYLGTTSDVNVEVELNGLEDDYPISRVIKKDIYGDVVVQQMQQTFNPTSLGNIENSTEAYNDSEFIPAGCSCGDHANHHYTGDSHANCQNFHHEREHNRTNHSVHHLPASVEKQSDIIRDQINRSVKNSLDCNLEYDEDVTDVKKFWSDLPFEQKKEICQIESSEVLKVIQEDPKASCNCRVCGNRKMTLEKELQKLYIGYYAVRKLASESLDECELNINLINTMFGVPLIQSSDNSSKIEETDNSAMDSVMSVANDLVKNNGENFINLLEQLHHANQELSDVSTDHISVEPLTSHNLHSKSHPDEQVEHFLNTASTNNLNKIEQLDDNHKEPIHELVSTQYADVEYANIDERDGTTVEVDNQNYYDYDDNNDEDTEELNDGYNSENDSATRRRLEETYKMLQLITSRVLRKKVYEAYKAKKADDISRSLLDEFAKEEAKLKEKEERLRRKKEKEKERKRLQRIAKEEEKKRLETEKLEKERTEKEMQLKKMEEGRKRKEAEKRKKEEELKKKQEEKRKRKEAELERQRAEKEEEEKMKLEERKKKEDESKRKEKEETEKQKPKENRKIEEEGIERRRDIMKDVIPDDLVHTQSAGNILKIAPIKDQVIPGYITNKPSFEGTKFDDQILPFNDPTPVTNSFQNRKIPSIPNTFLPFQEQSNLLNPMDPVFGALPQTSQSYPFTPQANAESNLVPPHEDFNSATNVPNWALNNLNTFNDYSTGQQSNSQKSMFSTSSIVPNMFNNDRNLFSNLPNSSTTNTPSTAPLSVKTDVNAQTAPLRNNSESVLTNIFNPLNTRPSSTSVLNDDIFKPSDPSDNFQNNNFWNNGPLMSTFSQPVQQRINFNDINALPTSQGSIWGNTNSSSDSQWYSQYNNSISQMEFTNSMKIEFIQREALKVSNMLPKLLNGGYSLDLLYRYAKPYIDAKIMHLTMPQFMAALATDLAMKVGVKFMINKDDYNDLFVSIITQDLALNPLNEFAGLSLQNDYKMGVRSNDFNSGNTLSAQSEWPQFN